MAMAAPACLLPSRFPKPTLLAASLHSSLPRALPLRCSPNGAAMPESPELASCRGRKKSPSRRLRGTDQRRTKKADQDPGSEGEEEPTKAKRTSRRTRKSKEEAKQEEVAQAASQGTKETIQEANEEEYAVEAGSGYDDDEEDFANEWPPLLCCFGALRSQVSRAVSAARAWPARNHPFLPNGESVVCPCIG